MQGSNDDMRQVVCRHCGKVLLKVFPKQVRPPLLQRSVEACLDIMVAGLDLRPPAEGPPGNPGPPPMRTAEASTMTESVENTREKRATTRWKRLVVMATYRHHGP